MAMLVDTMKIRKIMVKFHSVKEPLLGEKYTEGIHENRTGWSRMGGMGSH